MLFDKWCYFHYSSGVASSSSKIPAADENLEKPIKCEILYYHWSTVLVLSVILQEGLFGTTSLKISAQGGQNCVTDRGRYV